MKYCSNCKMKAVPVKRSIRWYDWLFFIGRIFLKRDRCPNCGGKMKKSV